MVVLSMIGVSVIHDGTNVGFQEYGQLTIHSSDAYSSTGNIGTFFPLMVGNDLVVRYTPDAGLTTAFINATAIGIATEGYIGIGSYDMAYADVCTKHRYIIIIYTGSSWNCKLW